MLWSRRRNGARTPGKGKKSVRVAARQTVESLETRRLFAYAMTQVEIDTADPQYTMAAVIANEFSEATTSTTHAVPASAPARPAALGRNSSGSMVSPASRREARVAPPVHSEAE